MATELKIKDGVLLDCQTDADTVSIPKEVAYVSKHAFDACGQIKIINFYPDYVAQELSRYVEDLLHRVAKGWTSKLYPPCILVYRIDPEAISRAIDLAVENTKKARPDIEWGTCTIAADKIEKMRSAKERGYDVAMLQNIPVAGSEGYGVLWVNGINAQNYQSLGRNFDHNLTRDHVFMGYPISLQWLVVIGTSIRLEGDPHSAFGPANCRSSLSEYLEYMECIGRVVE